MGFDAGQTNLPQPVVPFNVFAAQVPQTLGAEV